MCDVPKRDSDIVDYGEQFGSLHQASAIKKGVPTVGGHDRHHLSQMRYAPTLRIFYFTGLNVVVRYRVIRLIVILSWARRCVD
jgi:hypothetical protein